MASGLGDFRALPIIEANPEPFSQLINNAGRLMLYDDLLTHIWGPEYRDDIQLLRTCISRLRSKLEDDPPNPKLIRTIPRTGYIMDQPSA